MSFLSSFSQKFQILRSPERNIIAAIVDDPLKVQREIRFLLLRLVIFLIIAVAMITGSILSIRRGVLHIEENRALQHQVYRKFESMALLSHDVTEGRAALEKIQTFFLKDDNLSSFLNTDVTEGRAALEKIQTLFPSSNNLLQFLKALEALAKETDNKAVFHFDKEVPTVVPGMPSYRFVTYTITLEGDTRTLLRYLSAFHALPYLVVLDAITITGDHGISELKSTAQIKGRLYVQ